MIKLNKIVIIIIAIIILIGVIALGINIYVINSTENKIYTVEEMQDVENIDCILVLGAGVWGDKPSPMLEDRLLEGIKLYKEGISNKIIVSGDHTKENYDEVNIMKQYIIDKGVPSEDIFMDHAGIATYDSIYRAKEIFGVKKVAIVTQKYHLYRALHIAKRLDIEAYGVFADPREYAGQESREFREILARNKDFVKAIFKPKAVYMGDTIQVSGNGDITND